LTDAITVARLNPMTRVNGVAREVPVLAQGANGLAWGLTRQTHARDGRERCVTVRINDRGRFVRGRILTDSTAKVSIVPIARNLMVKVKKS
jgi:hypothetical protein